MNGQRLEERKRKFGPTQGTVKLELEEHEKVLLKRSVIDIWSANGIATSCNGTKSM